LNRIASPYWIPSCCRHSNILKTILVNCRGLTFRREYSHGDAHQDDKKKWEELSQEVQLNSVCNAGAKAIIQRQDITGLPQQDAFPLKPICMFVEKKMTSDTGPHIQYAAGHQVSCSFFHATLWMFTNSFDEVDWPNVYRTLNEEVPRLFQVWASKQVMNISATNKNLRWRYQDDCSNKFPCCTICHTMSRGQQGGSIYSVILGTRTMDGGCKYRPRPNQLHC
jgi:hypothetical protein